MAAGMGLWDRHGMVDGMAASFMAPAGDGGAANGMRRASGRAGNVSRLSLGRGFGLAASEPVTGTMSP